MIKRYLFILCISWAGSSLTQLFSQQRATAYIFMLEDCVICQSYTPYSINFMKIITVM